MGFKPIATVKRLPTYSKTNKPGTIAPGLFVLIMLSALSFTASAFLQAPGYTGQTSRVWVHLEEISRYLFPARVARLPRRSLWRFQITYQVCILGRRWLYSHISCGSSAGYPGPIG